MKIQFEALLVFTIIAIGLGDSSRPIHTETIGSEFIMRQIIAVTGDGLQPSIEELEVLG